MSPIQRLLSIFALTLMWSPSFLFIKLAVKEIPPFTIAAGRVTLAAVALLLLLQYLKRPLPREKTFWIHTFFMAFFSSVLPFTLFPMAEESIESALAAVVNGCSPAFTALLAHLLIPSDRMNLQKAIGISFSVVGLFLLFAPDLADGISESSTRGLLFATMAAISYGLSHVYGKKYMTGQAPLVMPAAQMLMSAVLLVPLSLFHDHSYALNPSLTALFGVGGLALCGTFAAYIIYYRLMEHCGATAISMVACFFPVVGMVLGFLFLGETLSIEGAIASACVLLGLMIVNGVIRLPIKSREDAAVIKE